MGKAVIVSWVTENEPGSSEVRYWSENNEEKKLAEGQVITYRYFNYSSGFIHHCTVKNLEVRVQFHMFMIFIFHLLNSKLLRVQLLINMFLFGQFNTKYYYEIGLDHTTRKFWFITPPEVGPDVPYTFGLIGKSLMY